MRLCIHGTADKSIDVCLAMTVSDMQSSNRPEGSSDDPTSKIAMTNLTGAHTSPIDGKAVPV